LSQYQI